MIHNLLAVAFVVLASLCGAVKGQVENPCEKGIDLGLIVDRSKSVGVDNFIIVKDALKSFVDNFNITPNTTHASLIFFAGDALHLFNLSDPKYHSNQAVKKAINSVPNRLYGRTRTDLALMKAHDHLFTWGQDRRKRPNVLVVFTDGKTAPASAPYSEVVPPLEDKGVNIIAVGIGKGIKPEELSKIAGERGSVVQVPDFNALAGKLSDILADVCIINGGYTSWSEWSQCSTTCGEGIRTRFRNCTNPEPAGGGKNCDDIGNPTEQEACVQPDCDQSIDGGYTRWTTWTQCSKTCGGGQRIRFRSCTSPPPNRDGKNCDHIGDPQETLKCNTQPCVKAPAPCAEGIDLGILIDKSKSIRRRNVERLFKSFMPRLFSKLGISRSGTHIGIITYNKDGNVIFTFKGRYAKSTGRATALIKGLDPSPEWHTRTDLGLLDAYRQLFVSRNGDRRRKQNVLLTFSDGRAWPKKRVKPFSETVPLLTGRRKCHMVAVGYGVPPKINMTQLREIAGDNVLKVNKPRGIVRMVRKIKKMVCSVDGGYSQWSMWSLCSATCGAGVKVRSRVCNSPPRRKGGKDCRRLGSPYETTECNEGECPTEPSPCQAKKMDICVILDSSLSVKLPNYVRVKTFLTQFVHYFHAAAHFSIITFAKTAVVQCLLADNECQTPDNVHDLIATIPDRLYWGTFPDKALIEANKTVFTPENGDRPDASNLVLVITDGKAMRGSLPYNVTVPPLKEGKEAKVLAFGVGPSIREEDLNEMAGERNWFYVEDFAEMKERIPDIMNAACNETVSNPIA